MQIFVCLGLSVYADDSTDFSDIIDVEVYQAQCYSGIASDKNSNAVERCNALYSYYVYDEPYSPTKSFLDNCYDDPEIMSEYGAFAELNAAADIGGFINMPLKKQDYYESVIVGVLYNSLNENKSKIEKIIENKTVKYTQSILGNICKDLNISSIAKLSEAFNLQDSKATKEWLEIFEKYAHDYYYTKVAGKVLGVTGNVLDYSNDICDFVDKMSTYASLAELDLTAQNWLLEMRSQCDSNTDPILRLALNTLIDAGTDFAGAFFDELCEMAIMDWTLNALLDAGIGSLTANNPVLLAVVAGLKGGKLLSDIFFAGSEVASQLYTMECVFEVEELSRLVVVDSEQEFRNNQTNENAKTFTYAVDNYFEVLINTEYNCMKEFLDTLYNGGILLKGAIKWVYGATEDFDVCIKALDALKEARNKNYTGMYQYYLAALKTNYSESYDFYITSAVQPDIDDVSFANASVGDIVTFGSYPQTDVTDSMSAILDGISATWYSYDYYAGDYNFHQFQSDYMKYCDVTFSGIKYRGVRFSSYRPYITRYSAGDWNTMQDENGYYKNKTYWFEYEPIKWKVLSKNPNGNCLIFAENILDSQDFYHENYGGTQSRDGESCYANSYKHSDIRKWLTGTFYNTAFSQYEKDSIIPHTVSSNDYTTSFSQGNGDVTDSVFMLSYTDILNTNYGFSSNSFRQKLGTDYAKCQGVYTTGKYSYYRLRSSGYFSYNSCFVSCDGVVCNDYGVDFAYVGCAPALYINSTIEGNNSTVSNTFNGNTYSIIHTPMTWENARLWCLAAGGHLVTIESEAENEYLSALIASTTESIDGYYIGLCKVNNKWRWCTGASLRDTGFDSWGPGMPDNYSGYQFVGRMMNTNYGTWQRGEWDDFEDGILLPFILEKESSPSLSIGEDSTPFDLKEDGYYFSNSHNDFDRCLQPCEQIIDGERKTIYKIPFDVYRSIDDTFTQEQYDKVGEWGGSCFGMCSTAALINEGKIESLTGYNETTYKGSKNVYKYRKDLYKSILFRINQYQIGPGFQNSSGDYLFFSDGYSILGSLSDLFSQYDNYLVYIYWEEKDEENDEYKKGAHEMVIDSSRLPQEIKDGWWRIYIYNPNSPDNKDRYVEINSKTGHWRISKQNIDCSTTLENIGFDKNDEFVYGSKLIIHKYSNVPTSYDGNFRFDKSSTPNMCSCTPHSAYFYMLDSNGKVMFSQINGKSNVNDSRISINESIDSDISSINYPMGEYIFVLSGGTASIDSKDGCLFIDSSNVTTFRVNQENDLSFESGSEASVLMKKYSSDDEYTLIETDIVAEGNDCTVSIGENNSVEINNNQSDCPLAVITGNMDYEYQINNGDYKQSNITDIEEYALLYGEKQPNSISCTEINVDDEVFTGDAIKPQITVDYCGTTLTEGIDYIVSGDTEVTLPGNYSITITGIGNYEGVATVEYSVFCEKSFFSVNGVVESDEYNSLMLSEEHAFRETLISEPDCINEGRTAFICSHCEEAFDVYEQAKGHDFAIIETVNPTCTEDGYEYCECTKCDATQYDTIEATGHSFTDSTTVMIKPTTTVIGLQTARCIYCDEALPTFIPTFMYGDVNDDETINAKDSYALKGYFADYKADVNPFAADLYVDDSINAKDSEILFSYLSNNLDRLPYINRDENTFQLFFNTSDSLERIDETWSNGTKFAINKNSLQLTSTVGVDPYVYFDLRDDNLSCSDYSYLVMTYKIPDTNILKAYGSNTFYVCGDINVPTAGYVSQSYSLDTSGQYAYIIYNLRNSNWEGELKGLRLDYFGECVKNDEIFIDSLVLTNSDTIAQVIGQERCEFRNNFHVGEMTNRGYSINFNDPNTIYYIDSLYDSEICYSDGALLAKAITGYDPQLYIDLSKENIDCSDYSELEIVYNIKDLKTSNSTLMKVFYITENITVPTPGYDTGYLPIGFSGDEFNTITVPLTNDNWTGKLNSLRIDFFEGLNSCLPNDSIYIKEINLISKQHK